jgi:phosphatidylglycerol:prolipoprotein diacylglycerol transferase
VVYPEFPAWYPPAAPPGVPLLNVPLMEAGFLLMLHAITAAAYLRSRRVGLASGLYLTLYGVWRFVIEFFRGDAVRGRLWIFTTSQYIAAAAAAFGIYLLLRAFRGVKTSKN